MSNAMTLTFSMAPNNFCSSLFLIQKKYHYLQGIECTISYVLCPYPNLSTKLFYMTALAGSCELQVFYI